MNKSRSVLKPRYSRDDSPCERINNNEIMQILEDCILLTQRTRIQRLSKAPLRLLYSKFLEYVALAFRVPIRVTAQTFWHEQMYLVIPEIVSMTIYRYGFYEEGVTKMLLNYLKPGMTFVDIGAHFGYFSLLSSALVGEKGQVHSFEPTPRTFNILKCNTSKKSNITVNNSAVYSKRGKIAVNDYGDKYAAYNSIYDARLPEDVNATLTPAKYEIETISVDEYVCANNIIPNFIKIDAESSEYEILLGMEGTIHDFHPLVSLEVGDDGVDNAPLSLSLVEFLVKRGYKAFEFSAGTIVPHLIQGGKYRFGNILFLPNT